MSSTLDPATGRAQITAKTLRTDRWWLSPLLTAAGLVAWVVYAMVRTFMQKWYFVPEYHYLTPFYSPCVSQGCDPAAATSAASCRTCGGCRTRCCRCRSCCCSG